MGLRSGRSLGIILGVTTAVTHPPKGGVMIGGEQAKRRPEQIHGMLHPQQDK